jgi:hypothetical protein
MKHSAEYFGPEAADILKRLKDINSNREKATQTSNHLVKKKVMKQAIDFNSKNRNRINEIR